MTTKTSSDLVCQICHEPKVESELTTGGFLRDSLIELIRKENPNWDDKGYICKDDLDRFRAEYVRNTLEAEKGDLNELESAVVKSMADEEILAKNINSMFESKQTIGMVIADKVAEFGGSWKFIISFGVLLVSWITINSIALLRKPFDPFPFILLNLFLSGLAAFQAPIIMMSQNRQESKDRLRAEHDYQVNLKAEIEIRNLHEKMDHMLHQQWQRLIEIQEIQTDMMEEIKGNTGSKKQTNVK